MTDGESDTSTHRMMSFNIQHGVGVDGRLGLARTARLVRDAQVDVAGLQEVDRHYGARSDFVDQAEWLARALDAHVVFGANIDLDPPASGRPRRQYGNAILTRHPVVDWDNVLLPRSGGHEQRGLLRARIQVGSVAWQVYTTHLEPRDAAERLAQARAVAGIIGAPGSPTVLLADVNATPGTPAVIALTDRLIDAWSGGRARCGATSPNPFPYRRVDYVMHSPESAAYATRVVGSILAMIASDHRPVLAELTPQPQPARG